MLLKFLVYCFVVGLVVSKFVGDECPDDKDGVCELVYKCEEARRQLRSNNQHNLARCGWSDITEIVCCPETADKAGSDSTPKPSNPLRISERECQKIKDEVAPPLRNYIIGGSNASFGEFPHMVALGYEAGDGLYSFDCGGSLISNRYVLTAAHCVVTRSRVPPSIVRMGVLELCPNAAESCAFNASTDVRVAENIVHPNYRSGRAYDDIALMRLNSLVTFKEGLGPVCLYTSDKEPGPRVIATGFGQFDTTVNKKSNFLLQANLTYVSSRECRKNLSATVRMNEGIRDTQICAVDSKRDTCNGDSGGPLVTSMPGESMFRLLGITSNGFSCASGNPAVYTAVFKYLDWIESIWTNNSSVRLPDDSRL